MGDIAITKRSLTLSKCQNRSEMTLPSDNNFPFWEQNKNVKMIIAESKVKCNAVLHADNS